MASVINTNIASLNAQRNLNSSQTALATSLQRLSSGLRINSAKDDAAGLAISDRFTTQIRGLNQAGRNANDAISLSQTAEGALGEVTNNLQRIRELAVQSSNATNSASDRAALDLEVQQRLAEIDRIAGQTSFNGQKILDGTFGQAAFQVGANVGETITLDLSTSMRTNSIGPAATVSGTTDLSSVFGGGTGLQVEAGQLQISIDGGTTNIDVAVGTYATAADLATAINTAYDTAAATTGSTIASASGDVITISNSSPTSAITIAGADAVTAGIDGTVAVAGQTPVTDTIANATFEYTVADLMIDLGGANSTAVATGTYDAAGLAAAINTAATAANGGTALTNPLASVNAVTGAVDIANTESTDFNFTGDGSTTADTTALGLGTVAADTGTATIADSVFKFTPTNLTIDVGTGTATAVVTSAVDRAGLIAAINAAATTSNGDTAYALASDDGAGGITLSNVSSTLVVDFGSTSDAVALGLTTLAASTSTSPTTLAGASLTTELAAVNDATPLTLAAGQLSVQVGADTAVSVVGTFTSAEELATAISSQVDGVNATYDSTTGLIQLRSSSDITLTSSDTTAPTTLDKLGLATGLTVADGDLSTLNIATVAASNEAIFRIDTALTAISDLRSTFGAIQNRFESTINNLATSVENLSAARSRIMDADFASETAELTRAQILQQAGTAMLSQANQIPQNVLSLLQG